MGYSGTYHVIGYAPLEPGREAVYGCMTKTEMAQSVAKAKRDGHPITHWWAQTTKGCRMLGGEDRTATPKLPKLVECPICRGWGCHICNYAGICRRGHWNKWQEWQREAMRREALAQQVAYWLHGDALSFERYRRLTDKIVRFLKHYSNKTVATADVADVADRFRDTAYRRDWKGG